MGPDRPVEYQELVDRSIAIDNWIYERQLERRGGYGRAFGGGSYRAGGNSYDRGDPMDLSVMQHGKPASKTRGFRGRGRGGYQTGNRERERQRKENLCFNCDKPGHRARDCKTTAQGLHMMMSDGITGSGETKADTPDETREKATSSQGTTAQEGCQELEVCRKPGTPKEDEQEAFDRAMSNYLDDVEYVVTEVANAHLMIRTKFWEKYDCNHRYCCLPLPHQHTCYAPGKARRQTVEQVQLTFCTRIYGLLYHIVRKYTHQRGDIIKTILVRD